MLKRWGVVALVALGAIGFNPAQAEAQLCGNCQALFGCTAGASATTVICTGGPCVIPATATCAQGSAASDIVIPAFTHAGPVCVCGGGGGDTINGTAASFDWLEGGEGDDTINAGAGDDFLFGEDGADTLNGEGGADQIFGGADGDDIDGGTENDTINGNEGADQIDGGDGNDTISGDEGDDGPINGGDGNDALNGGAGADTLNGDAGADDIDGGADNDVINGGAGDDPNLAGGDGDDTINGNAGMDTATGGTGNDLISGGADNDNLSGNAGFDVINGDDGDDTLNGNDDPDVIDGGPGTDTTDGGAAADTCLNSESTINCENFTHAALASFGAFTDDGDVIVEWVTSSEAGTIGYYLFREEGGEWVQVHEALLPSVMAPQGGTYHFRDVGAAAGATLSYRLVEVDGYGSNPAGPFEVIADSAGDSLLSATQFYAREPAAAAALARARKGDAIGSPQSPGQADAVYLGVDATGLYSVTAAEIASRLGMDAADVSAAIMAGTVRISEAGEAVAWSGAPDGSSIQFFGVAIESLFARERFYRLSLEAGDTMATQGAAPGAVTPGLTYQDTVHIEEDATAVTVIPQDPNSDYWYGPLVSESGPMAATITVPLESVAGDGTLRVTFRGAGNREDVAAIRVLLNGQDLGTTSFVGQIAHEFEVPVPQAGLADGDNTLLLEPVRGSAFVDFAEVTYDREYTTSAEALEFRSAAAASLELTGFADAGARLFNITDARQPVELTGFVSDPAGLQFAAEANQEYFVASTASVRGPSSIWGDVPSDLRNAANEASYLIIAPPEFAAGAQELAAYRDADDLQTMVVELQDIFDEFAFGAPDPNAIRDFLRFANEEWATAPQYAVLLGKGSWDYRDLQGLGGNFVPPIMLSTPGGLYSSDVTYADVAGDDGVPDLAIGRLPVTTTDELDAVIGQIMVYESMLDDLSREVLLVAGQTDPQGDYTADTAGVRDALAEDWTATEVLRTAFDRDFDGLLATRDALFTELGDGPRLLSYLGHGARDRLGKIESDPDTMATSSIFELGDLDTLSIGGSQPIFNAMTCTAARFALPGSISLGESLLLDSEGAIAAWSASGVSAHELARDFAETFVGSLTSGEDERIGDAINRSYAELSDELEFKRETIGVYHLLGDPALRLLKGTTGGTGGSGGMAGAAGSGGSAGSGGTAGSGGAGGGVAGGGGGCAMTAAPTSSGLALAFVLAALLGMAIVRQRRRRDR